jgi:HK97 family phage major capsid protein
MAKLTADDIVTTVRSVVSEKREKALAPASKATGTDALTRERVPATARNAAEEASGGFRSPREFIGAVLKAYQNSNEEMDPRLVPFYAKNAERANDGHTTFLKAVGSDEGTGIHDSYGGFLIPTTFSPNLMKVDPEADPIGRMTTNVPMATPTIKIPARVDKDHTTSVSGGLTVTRRPETVAGTASRMEFEQIALNATSLFGLSYATEELLMDSPISFAALLAAGFSDQFTYHLINERISGTGVGEFEGILTSPALVSVAKETGQEADTIVYENVLKMRSRCWGYSKAIWLANHDTMPQLMKLNQAVGTGGAVVWQPSAREDHPDILLGRPLYFTEYAKTVGDKGDLILGNWAEYLEGTYQPLQNEESIHVRFVNHERTFKFWMRNDGRCWWRSALTPKNSTATLSPFVVLDARA